MIVVLSGAAAHGDSLVRDIGLSVFLAGMLSVLFTRLKIPSIAAFLAAGIFAGPEFGKLVTDKGNIETIAHLGLVLLLFLIGLEINLKKILASGRTLVLTGLLQFPLCVAFGFAVAWLIGRTGWAALAGPYTPLYVGITAAASSTLLVVKLLQERFQFDTVVGRVALGILIFQDLWAMVVLAAQPNFAQPDMKPVALTFVGIGALIAVTLILARLVLPTCFHWIAKVPELLLVAALGWCFGIGLLGESLGNLLGTLGVHADIHVSQEMGALIAGASIASLPYSGEVMAKVSAVRDFFVTLFFVGLGMGIPLPDGVDVLALSALIMLIAVASRYVVFKPLLYYTGFDRRAAIVTATKLVPISEFCLVIAYLGAGFGHLSGTTVSAVIFAFVITAVAYPFIFETGDVLHDRLGPLLTRLGFKPPASPNGASGGGQESWDVVLLGFHRIASSLLCEIERHDRELLARTLVVDFNVALHADITKRGATAHYGDISNPDTLRHAGVAGAKVIICTIPDDVLKGTSNLQLAKVLRQMTPEAIVIVNAVQVSDARAMRDAGADHVFLSRFDSATNLVGAIDAALSGAIKDYHSSHVAKYGPLEDRREILP